MAQSGNSSRSTERSNKPPAPPRRFWTHQEEETLIHALKNLRAGWWRCDGSFRGSYMVRLKSMMNQKFPDCGILVKHIKSKLQVWKKTYSTLRGILGCSGGGGVSMDPTSHMIIIESESVWSEYVKVNPDAAKLRGKPHLWYDSWVEIFGNDRATGEFAFDTTDVVQELLRDSQNEGEKANESGEPHHGYSPGSNVDFDAVSVTPHSIAGSKKNASSFGKRKRVDRCADDFEKIVGSLLEDTKTTLGSIAEKLHRPQPQGPDLESSLRTSLFDALQEIPGLDLQQQVKATHHLANNKADMDVF